MSEWIECQQCEGEEGRLVDGEWVMCTNCEGSGGWPEGLMDRLMKAATDAWTESEGLYTTIPGVNDARVLRLRLGRVVEVVAQRAREHEREKMTAEHDRLCPPPGRR